MGAAGNGTTRTLIFVPTFSDRAALPGLAAEISAATPGAQLLIIDDGSEPAVAAPSDSCLLVRLPGNYGLGVSTHIAFRHALRWGYDALVRIDADGQHAPADVPRLVKALEAADVVVGLRTNANEASGFDGWGRRALKWYFSAVAGLLTGGRVPLDVNSGFFAANPLAMRKLVQTSFERFPEPEILVTACRAGLRVTSVPVQQRPRHHGRSTISVLSAFTIFFRFNIFALNVLLRGR